MPSEPVEYLDFAALRRHVANYDALFDKLLELFLEQGPLWIEEIDAAFAGHDPDLLRQVCHKIKGGAGTLQARFVIEAVAELNRHALSGDLTGAGPSRGRLVSAIDGTLAFVQASGHIKPPC